MGDKLFLLMICFQFTNVLSVMFEVGGGKEWCLPTAKDDDNLYNTWASKNRFNVNDTLHFTYNKDSVLEITGAEYEQCQSSHPLFYSNNGDTKYTFSRPGLFYFISGVSGHCERGQKMIIKVLEPQIPPSPKTPNETSSPPCCIRGASSGCADGAMFPTAIVFVMSLIWSILF